MQTGGEETPALRSGFSPPSPPLYEFPFGLKEIDFGKQTTNYKLHGSCFIKQTKRAILHEELLNEGILAELMQKWNIPMRSLKLPGCLLQGIEDTLRAHFQNKNIVDHRLLWTELSLQSVREAALLWDMLSYKVT